MRSAERVAKQGSMVGALTVVSLQVLVQPVVKVAPRAAVPQAPLALPVLACSGHSAARPNRTMALRLLCP